MYTHTLFLPPLFLPACVCEESGISQNLPQVVTEKIHTSALQTINNGTSHQPYYYYSRQQLDCSKRASCSPLTLLFGVYICERVCVCSKRSSTITDLTAFCFLAVKYPKSEEDSKLLLQYYYYYSPGTTKEKATTQHFSSLIDVAVLVSD